MIWALLALLGVPIWLIVVVLLAALRNRRSVRTDSGVFIYKEYGPKGWPRQRGYARWVSDVLILHSGIALIRSEATQATSAGTIEEPTPPSKGLGEEPITIRVAFADGSTAIMAVPSNASADAFGPWGER